MLESRAGGRFHSKLGIPILAISHGIKMRSGPEYTHPPRVYKPKSASIVWMSRLLRTVIVECDLRRDNCTSSLRDPTPSAIIRKQEKNRWSHSQHDTPSSQSAIGVLVRWGYDQDWSKLELLILVLRFAWRDGDDIQRRGTRDLEPFLQF